MSGATYDVDVPGVVKVRVPDASPADAAKVARQLGLPVTAPAGTADLTVRFVDVATRQPLTFVGLGDAGFNRDGFFVLQEPGRHVRTHTDPVRGLPRAPGRTCPEIVSERSVSAVPHLLAMVNLVALGRDVLPLHASAFTLDGLNVLVTGWSKGGKTEALLAAMARGASYVGDEWVYLTPTREMLGLPEPMRVWDWHLEQFPDLLGRRDRHATGSGCRPGGPSGPRLARPGATGLPGAGLASRVHPLAARQANLRVPPRDLFGTDRVALRAPLDATVLLLSHSSPEITVELVEQAEVARRMAASLVEERARFLAHYRQFRYRVRRTGRARRWSPPPRTRPGC